MISTLEQIAISPDIQEIFLVANTPEYVARKLKASSLVRAASDIFSHTQLKDYILESERSESQSLLITEVVAIVALILQNTDQAYEDLSGLGPLSDPWAEFIRINAISNFIPTEVQNFTARPTVNSQESDENYEVQVTGSSAWN